MKKVDTTLKPVIFWEGLPVCGLLMKKVAEKYGDDLIIVATRPAVPFEGLEEMLGHTVVWMSSPDEIWERREEFSDRNFVIHTGWRHRGWLRYDRYVKKKNNAKIVCVVDNRFKGNLRQLFGGVWFRIFLRRYFDAVFVPGESSFRLMRFFGMPAERVYRGNYGAYEGIYSETQPILSRSKEFLFVGQLVERKGVDILVQSYKKYRASGGAWTLRLTGAGPLKEVCSGEGIFVEDFSQPSDIAERMNHARVLVLPSREEHWGTVVCEAAACGMHLLTTRQVGSSADLVCHTVNGYEVPQLSQHNLFDGFRYFENMSDNDWVKGSNFSKETAQHYGSSNYYRAFCKMVSDLYESI